MYHGIIIDQEFTDKAFPESFKVFAKKQDGTCAIYRKKWMKLSEESSIGVSNL